MSEEEVKEPVAGGILEDVNIEEEMSRDYIDYSMSVIVGRALPDVRDGLKPVTAAVSSRCTSSTTSGTRST